MRIVGIQLYSSRFVDDKAAEKGGKFNEKLIKLVS